MGRSISSIPLAEAREAWLEDARFRGLSPATLREYERVSAAVLSYTEGEAGAGPSLADLTARRVRRWLTERSSQQRRGGSPTGGVPLSRLIHESRKPMDP